jgi:hypothetical protein
MCDWLILAILAALGLSIWATIVLQAGSPWPLRIVHILVCLAAAIAAALTTFNYDYFPNSNTMFRGWPVPYIIFQRENADAPWLDFIGATILFAYPLNLIIYLTPPSLVLLAVHYLFRRRTTRAQTANSAAP